MAISSIQKQNTIYRKQEYKKETYTVKEQTQQTENMEQNEIENVAEDVKESKDVFVTQQKKEDNLPSMTKQNEQKKNNVDYQATEDLIKLMQAKTVSEVRSIIARIKGDMAKTKVSGGDEDAIKSVVAKMKKVIKKAQSKEKALIAENKMELQMKMKEKTEVEKAEEIGEELQSKRKKRMSKEINDVLNSSNDFSGGSASEQASFMDMGGDFSMSMPEISSIDISV